MVSSKVPRMVTVVPSQRGSAGDRVSQSGRGTWAVYTRELISLWVRVVLRHKFPDTASFSYAAKADPGSLKGDGKPTVAGESPLRLWPRNGQSTRESVVWSPSSTCGSHIRNFPLPARWGQGRHCAEWSLPYTACL